MEDDNYNDSKNFQVTKVMCGGHMTWVYSKVHQITLCSKPCRCQGRAGHVIVPLSNLISAYISDISENISLSDLIEAVLMESIFFGGHLNSCLDIVFFKATAQ